MEVSIQELKSVADKLFAHLQRDGKDVVEVPHDFYWSIPKEERYDPYSIASQPTLGQLSDDLFELRRIVHGEAEPIAYGLVWLASIIRAIGEEVVA